jgi:hypothetical protein
METKAEYVTQAPLAISEQRETYVREDGTTFTRSDIFVKLAVTFRDAMLAKLKGPPLSVYLCIALHCGDAGMTAYPSVATIVRETGYSKSAVLQALRKLREMALINIAHRTKANGAPDSHLYKVRGHATMGEGSTPSVPQVVHLVDGGSTPSVPKEETIKEESIEEQEPPPADSLPAGCVGIIREPLTYDGAPITVQLEIVADEESFYLEGETPTKPAVPRTEEEHKAGIQRALETYATTGGNAGVADPTQDTGGWGGTRLLMAFAAVTGTPWEEIKPSSLKDWPKQFEKWAETWPGERRPTVEETTACVRGVLESEHDWKTWTSPRSPDFQGVLDLMISRHRAGRPWHKEGRKNGGSSTPRTIQADDGVAEAVDRLFDETGRRRKEPLRG